MGWQRSFAGGLFALLVSVGLAIAPALSQTVPRRAEQDAGFPLWLESTVWPDAQRKGVTRDTFRAATAGLSLDWSLPELGAPGSGAGRRQAEFQSPSKYFPEAQLAGLAKEGRDHASRLKIALSEIERRYGVPSAIVLAVWGRESHFGQVAPRRDGIRVLATQAYAGRRRDLYYPEFLAALVILEQDHVARDALRSSWAGAMGQPQFLPSKFLAYAVDGDGDGRRDIWGSAPDTLASIAHYLREHGWRTGREWGTEIRLPATVPCSLEGPGQGRSATDWLRLGITGAGGRNLSDAARAGERFLMMPIGRYGPAFLVSENFYVLKQYNESDLYALFIGLLADRIDGGQAATVRWPELQVPARADLFRMQQRLVSLGYDVGRVDGLVGFATRTAVGRWQAREGRSETCFPDAAMVEALASLHP